MFKIRRTVSPDKDEIKVEGIVSSRLVSDQVARYAEGKLLRQIVDELAKMWIEKHGAAFIDKISGEDVLKHIKTKLAERILEK